MYPFSLDIDHFQCLILASRPILIYTLQLRKEGQVIDQESRGRPNETVIALSQACIESARCSCRILTDAWITGTFPNFDFAYTQWLFSAATILGMSSLSQSPKAQDDGDDFEVAAEIMNQLAQNGSFTAKEFNEHVVAIRTVIVQKRFERSQVDLSGFEKGPVPNESTRLLLQDTGFRWDMPIDSSSNVFAESSLEDLLAQPEFNLDFLEPSMLDDGFEAFLWQDQYLGSHGQDLASG